MESNVMKEIPQENSKEMQITATFDETFHDLLEEIKAIEPEPGAGAGSKRWKAIKGHDDSTKKRYDEFILTIRKGYNYREAEKTSKAQKINDRLDPDAGLAGFGKKDIDDICLMSAVIEAINSWTGEESDSFIRIVLKKYNQHAGAAATAGHLSSLGGTTSFKSASSKYRMKNAIMAIREVIKIDQSKDVRTIIEALSEDSKGKALDLSDEMKEEIIVYMESQRNVLYLDAPAGEDSDETMGDCVPDEMQSHPFDRERMKTIFSDFEEKWEKIRAGVDKKNLNYYKELFSRDILVQLKLCKLNRDVAHKEYPDDLEPDCKRWCPYRDSCTIGKSGRKCYVRFDRMIRRMFQVEKESAVLPYPAGDEEVYKMLAEDEQEVYNLLLNNTYVKNAFIKEPQNLKDIYANVLKDFNGKEGERFRFTDDFIAKALKLKDNSSISRAKEGYVKTVGFLYNISKEK